MRGTASALLARNICKQVSSHRVSWGGLIPSLEPKKPDTNISEVKMNGNEKADPIVTFSRPPPFSPFIGPLVAFSLVETWSSRDADDGN